MLAPEPRALILRRGRATAWWLVSISAVVTLTAAALAATGLNLIVVALGCAAGVESLGGVSTVRVLSENVTTRGRERRARRFEGRLCAARAIASLLFVAVAIHVLLRGKVAPVEASALVTLFLGGAVAACLGERLQRIIQPLLGTEPTLRRLPRGMDRPLTLLLTAGAVVQLALEWREGRTAPLFTVARALADALHGL